MIFVLCGIPGSGKTTLSRKIAEEHNALLYCYDELPGANHPKTYTEVRRAMRENAARDLRNGLTVVLDDLHTTRATRSDLLSVLDGIDCKKTIIVMRTPYDVCIQRNANRKARIPEPIIQSIHTRFEIPRIEEGWDEIICWKGGDNQC